jgi:hypothetical protein
MQANSMTPSRLAKRLLIYFVGLIGLFAVLAIFTPWAGYLPIGGHELDLPGTADEVLDTLQRAEAGSLSPIQTRIQAALVLTGSLSGTILLMLPITWVYMAMKLFEGYRKNFVKALIVLPICATSIVLLIQDSLALAFGLAGLVAAVRFRVQLNDALDGIYIFAAICVGLASGVGYLGVGLVMTLFFCFASVILWGMDYGANPIEAAKQARKRAALETASKDIVSPR